MFHRLTEHPQPGCSCCCDYSQCKVTSGNRRSAHPQQPMPSSERDRRDISPSHTLSVRRTESGALTAKTNKLTEDGWTFRGENGSSAQKETL